MLKKLKKKLATIKKVLLTTDAVGESVEVEAH